MSFATATMTRPTSAADRRIAELELENEALREQVQVSEESTRSMAVVIESAEGFLTVAKDGDYKVIPYHDAPAFAPGDTLLVDNESGRIIGDVPDIGVGPVVQVSKLDPEDTTWVEVTGQNGSMRVRIDGVPGDNPPLELEDRVVLDRTGTVITTRLPRPKRKPKPVESIVRWHDIGGQEEAKAILREIIEAPKLYPELYQAYKRRATKGVLLYGPPGCGKTMLGKAAATAMQGDTYVESGFIYVKATEILNQFVGVSESNVRGLFAKAKRHHETHGTPAIIFIDEADAILGVRGERMNLGMEQTIVPAFLTEMDGMDDSGAVVILATNRPDTLDPAVIRDGRIDRKVLVGRPGPSEVMALSVLYLRKVPIEEKLDVRLAAVAIGRALYQDDGKPTELGKIASGSLVAGIVDRAASIAFMADAADGASHASGVGIDDLDLAIEAAARELGAAQTNHLHL